LERNTTPLRIGGAASIDGDNRIASGASLKTDAAAGLVDGSPAVGNERCISGTTVNGDEAAGTGTAVVDNRCVGKGGVDRGGGKAATVIRHSPSIVDDRRVTGTRGSKKIERPIAAIRG